MGATMRRKKYRIKEKSTSIPEVDFIRLLALCLKKVSPARMATTYSIYAQLTFQWYQHSACAGRSDTGKYKQNYKTRIRTGLCTVEIAELSMVLATHYLSVLSSLRATENSEHVPLPLFLFQFQILERTASSKHGKKNIFPRYNYYVDEC